MFYLQKRALNRLLTGLILLILVLMTALLVKRAMDAPAEEDMSPTEASTSAQLTGSAALFTALSYRTDDMFLSFSLGDDDVWYWDSNRSFPLDTTVIDGIMEYLASPELTASVARDADPKACGLEDSDMHLTAASPDGSRLSLTFGEQAPGSTGCYMIKDDDPDTVYIVSGTLPASMAVPIHDMISLPQLPRLTERTISSVTVKGAAETVLVAFEHNSSGEKDNGSTVLWLCGGTDVSSNPRLQTLITALGSAKLDACENFDPSPDAVTFWGLDTPAATAEINYGTDQRLTLRIGARTLDGDGYYVRMDRDPAIYSMSAELLKPLLTIAERGLT